MQVWATTGGDARKTSGPVNCRECWQADQPDAGDLAEVPDGLGEEAVGGGVVALSSLSGGLPDATDGASSQADDPGGDHASEEVEDLLSEDSGEGC